MKNGSPRCGHVQVATLKSVVFGGVAAVFLAVLPGQAFAQISGDSTDIICDLPPIGGTEFEELDVTVASLPPRVRDNDRRPDICDAAVGIQIFDVVDIANGPVGGLPRTPLPVGGSLKLTYAFDPASGPRQDVVIRLALTPRPATGVSLSEWLKICSVVASAQWIDRATGKPLGLIDGGDWPELCTQ